MDSAAAHAHAGDTAAVELAMSAIPNSIDRKKYNYMDRIFDIGCAYAAAGRYELALKLLREGDPSDLYWHLWPVAAEMVFAGQYDRARQLVMELTPRNRVSTLCDIAVGEVKSGKTAGLTAWIDALPSPQERVVIDIAVANAINGRTDRYLQSRLRDHSIRRPR